MSAIFKREFKSYFATPLGYIFLTVYYFFLGIAFDSYYSYGMPNIDTLILSMNSIMVFTVPVITMRLMSEERRQKIDQILLTAPVKLSAIVLGKFLAAFAILSLAFAPTIIFEIIFASYVSVNILIYIYLLLGALLLGAAFIAIGMFISSLTESPVISAILTFVINIIILLSANLSSLISAATPTGEGLFSKIGAFFVKVITVLFEKADMITVASEFSTEIFSIPNIVYFLSIITAFLFLSVRSLEKRRWS